MAAHPDGGNLAGFDQPVYRAKVDLEVLQDFFRGEKNLVVWEVHAH